MTAPPGNVDLGEIVGRLADRSRRARTEADVQSDVRLLLLASALNLTEGDVEDVSLETQVGAGRRIDVEMGSCIIEVKKDLRRGQVLANAVDQLAGYVRERSETFGRRYVGVLTDGADWRLYHLDDAGLTEISTFSADPTSPEGLIGWIGGVLTTEDRIPPTAATIENRLGAESSGHALDLAELQQFYGQHKNDPEVAIKRELWSKLLTTALGTQFSSEDDDLFVEHTYLVVIAECIAHAVLGYDLNSLAPSSIVQGDLFSRDAQILGVVEQDFFDWPLDCGAAGKNWVGGVARRIAQFDWSHVPHDVMKTIYQSVISAEVRKALGEYYTPDFLAEAMAEAAVTNPLEQRTLDPSCGSGTFLFHLVRRYLAAADSAGIGNHEAVAGAAEHVIGVDVHPVAVSLARVTYLLALGSARLRDPSRGPLRIPVFLGDSLQWGQRQNLFSSESLNVATSDGTQLFADELRFPEHLLADADRFDQLVADLADKACNRVQNTPVPPVAPIARRHGITGDDLQTIERTFDRMCKLHDEGRDHIWGYFVRNLARPAWLAQAANRVDVLIGNPPWLSYRFMTTTMQESFRSMSEERKLWSGGAVATQQDLSDLFIARCVEQYLSADGKVAFVMPAAALTRQQYRGFRSGDWSTTTQAVTLRWEEPWDLSMLYPYFFPRTSAVVFGHRSTGAGLMPREVEKWTGSIADTTAAWSEVAPQVNRSPGSVDAAQSVSVSEYRERFANGATIFPRVLTTVAQGPTPPAGTGAGRVAVHSARGTYEKKPWKLLEGLEGVVETQFVWPLLLGENVLPFRQASPLMGILPIRRGKMLDGEIADFPGLAAWWSRAEALWNEHRSSKLTLAENLNYRRKLTNQFPLAPERVVYGASGMHVTACRVTEPDAVVEHQLYWAASASPEESLYLCAILNSATFTSSVERFMVSGKGGGRHIDTYLWQLPVPTFDSSDLHRELAELGRAAELEISDLELPEMSHGALRRRIRAHLRESSTGQALERCVAALLPPD